MQGVIFDLGGVVHESPIMAIRKFCALSGIADLNPFLGLSGAWNSFMQGKISTKAFFVEAYAEARAAGLQGITEHTFPQMMEAMAGSGARPLMVRSLRRLRAAGIKTCALTNNFATPKLENNAAQAVAEAQHAKFVALFDGFIESVVVGYTKPDPRMYELALEEMQVEADKACFLDDIGQNLKPAKKMGIHTILVENDTDTAFHGAVWELSRLTGVQLLDGDEDTVPVEAKL
jgi:epoxide hydrolase-like predicted phosphatase